MSVGDKCVCVCCVPSQECVSLKAFFPRAPQRLLAPLLTLPTGGVCVCLWVYACVGVCASVLLSSSVRSMAWTLQSRSSPVCFNGAHWCIVFGVVKWPLPVQTEHVHRGMNGCLVYPPIHNSLSYRPRVTSAMSQSISQGFVALLITDVNR